MIPRNYKESKEKGSNVGVQNTEMCVEKQGASRAVLYCFEYIILLLNRT